MEAIAKACDYPQLVSIATVESSVMMWMVPPATVAVAYCINFDKEKILASDTSLISTFVAIPGIIFWVLILTVIAATGYFPA
jgi:predicted permease